MPDSTTALKLFESLADSVWNWLADARRLDLGFSEDSITDLTALEIARHLSSMVTVKRVSKQRERYGGFDWMWVIRRPSGRNEIYVVQAKKMKLDQSDAYLYGTLKYRAGKTHQIKVLKKFADWLGAKPLYCFYNNVNDDTAMWNWNCPKQPLDISQLGCTLVPLEAVKVVHDNPSTRNDFCSIHADPRALPWRCLFDPQCIEDDVFGPANYAPGESTQRMNKFDDFLEYLTKEGAVVKIKDVIDGLDLGWLVDKYATRRFRPIPERFAIFNLEDSS